MLSGSRHHTGEMHFVLTAAKEDDQNHLGRKKACPTPLSHYQSCEIPFYNHSVSKVFKQVFHPLKVNFRTLSDLKSFKLFVADDEGQACSTLLLHHWIYLQLTATERVAPSLLPFASPVHTKQTHTTVEWMAKELGNGKMSSWGKTQGHRLEIYTRNLALVVWWIGA